MGRQQSYVCVEVSVIIPDANMNDFLVGIFYQASFRTSMFLL